MNLTGYVNLKDTKNYQIIYATKIMSSKTFFCVYVKLTTTRDGKLTGIDLYLKNYNSSIKHGFKKRLKDIFVYEDKVLRIGCETEAFRNSSDYGYKDLTSLNIKTSEIKGIFFTSRTKYFEEIKSNNLNDLTNLTLEPDDESLVDFFNKNLNTIVDLEGANAVGNNCRVSLMEVTGG